MGYTVSGTSTKEVTIRADMNVSEQCDTAPSKGNQILLIIWRNIAYKEIIFM